ncbi:MAG: hypothetical protein IPK10_03585 [Bacteroidetes bacterium]|nr:hypothetical protein [Bacteroidota bacterium]
MLSLLFSNVTVAQDTLVKSILPDTLIVKGENSSPDTIPFRTDTVLVQTQTPLQFVDSPKVHSVRKATLLSTYLPGAGQVYNRKSWKVPIIYAAFAGMGYLIKFNHDNFKKFDKALVTRYDNDPNTVDAYATIYSEDNLRSLSDFYRRNRDLSVIGLTLIYVLNIVDAHVDAHLFNFNVDDDLSLRVNPTFEMGPYFSSAGLSLSLHF